MMHVSMLTTSALLATQTFAAHETLVAFPGTALESVRVARHSVLIPRA